MDADISRRVVARYVEASWTQANGYVEALKKSLESQGGQINHWEIQNRGNISFFLDFVVEGPNGHKKGEVEFRGTMERPGHIRTKWVRYEGKYYDRAPQLAKAILG